MASGEPENGKDPEEILSTEIWKRILSNLTRTDDLTNCYNVCQGWRKLLEPRRMTFVPQLMAKVFQLIDDKVEYSAQSILNLRLLSHSWKAAIDHFLQHHPHHYNLGFSSSRTLPDVFLPFLPFHTFKISDFTKLHEFLENTEDFPNAEPFFSRTIRYLECANSTGESYLTQFNGQTIRVPFHAFIQDVPGQRSLFRDILSRFGMQIWHASFVFTLKKTESQDFYETLYFFLRLMPNLRSLTIRVEEGLDDLHKMTPDLRKLLVDEPLPPLEHLIFLGMRNVQEPVQSGMLNKYKHIKRLSFQNTSCRPSFPPNYFQNLEFNSLEQMSTFNYCVEDIQMLHSKAGVWPLTHMNLRWIQIPDLPLVFRAISGFSSTLKHLKLEFRGVKTHDFETLTVSLNLPHLESLKITCVQSYLNVIDFLMPSVELKKLELETWIPSTVKPAFDSPPQVIQFGGCASAMYNSNIWKVLKNLNKMVMKTVVNCPDRAERVVRDRFFYSRAQYLELLKAAGVPLTE